MSRRNTKKRPPPRTSTLCTVIESLEPRAMLAGVGPESWSAPGLAPAPLGTGVLSSSGIILTCSSPAPGSSGAASPPAPTSGSGGTTSGGDLWDSFSVGSGAGGSKSGSTGGVSTDGPALSSQYTGGSGVGGQGNGTGGTLSNADLWRMYWSGAGAGSSSSSSDEGSLADDPTISARYTGGSGIVRITPLVYNPESDGPPVFDSGLWTENAAGVQFVQAADTGSGQGGGNPPAGRPTWNNDDAQDYYFGPRWLFEFEAGMGVYDPPNEIPKPRDELAGVVPTDPNGTYQAGRKQEFDTLPAQVAEKGKEFAWFMGEWYADRALGAAANGGVKLLNVAGASLPLWFVTRCGTVIERGSVALGLGNRLDNFATGIGAQTWKQLVPDSPELWQSKFRELLNDGTTRFTFNLDGVDVWRGVARAARGDKECFMTDWELLQLKMTKEAWNRITWIKDGKVVPCPFE